LSIIGTQPDNDTLYDWLALERIPRVGPLTIAKLLEAFKTPKAAMEAHADEIRRRTGLGEKLAAIISSYKPPHSEILEDLEIIKRLDVNVILRWNPDYPKNLREIYDPPALLFVRGGVVEQDERAVGIVGTRNPTAYGMEMTRTLTRDLVRAGVTIVSGLARGIDTTCHKTAVKEGGRTIGVLGCGLDVVYPRENGPLMEEMVRYGAVVSEFRPRVQPLGTNFYRRNRIISGLSKGVLVVEAAMGSGSLITAKHALDQNRDVLAVPGNILNSRSAGPHHLLKQGAALVQSADDVIECLFRQSPAPAQPPLFRTSEEPDVSPEAKKVLDVIELDPIPIDLICEAAKMEAGKVSGILLELELSGLVKQHPGKMFARPN
jgi:DNA processing protein